MTRKNIFSLYEIAQKDPKVVPTLIAKVLRDPYALGDPYAALAVDYHDGTEPDFNYPVSRTKASRSYRSAEALMKKKGTIAPKKWETMVKEAQILVYHYLIRNPDRDDEHILGKITEALKDENVKIPKEVTSGDIQFNSDALLDQDPNTVPALTTDIVSSYLGYQVVVVPVVAGKPVLDKVLAESDPIPLWDTGRTVILSANMLLTSTYIDPVDWKKAVNAANTTKDVSEDLANDFGH